MTRPSSPPKRAADERGVAMVTTLVAIVVVSLLLVTSLSVANHTSLVSSNELARAQAIHTGEAGLDGVLASLATTPTASLPCTVAATYGGSASITISYYPTYPPSGPPLTCTGGVLGSGGTPAAAVLVSTGSIPVTGGAVRRKMETQVRLNAVSGAFDETVFSDQSPSMSNSTQVNGNVGNDAIFYTNGDWNCSNSFVLQGSAYAQGTASTGNSCRVAADLWANGDVTMGNSSTVSHNVTSSTGSLTMGNSSWVGNNIRLGATCSGCSGMYGGTLTESSPEASPPAHAFPAITYNASAWISAGYTEVPFTSCTNARNWLTNGANSGTKAVVRITGGCTLSFRNSTVVTRSASIAIVTDGEITMANSAKFTSASSTFHDLHFIVVSGSSCTGNDGDITLRNSSQFAKLYTFLYSPCQVNLQNSVSGVDGQIYAGITSLANSSSISFHPMTVPGGGTVTGYTPDIAFVREIR